MSNLQNKLFQKHIKTAKVKRLKIFQFSFGDGFAGSAKMALLSSDVLLQKGYDVTLFTSQNSLTASRAKQRNIPLVEFDSRQKFNLLMKQIIELYEKEKPRIVFSYHSLDRKVGIALKRKFGKKIINISYRQNMSESAPIIGAIIYNLYNDYVLACSNGVAKSLVRSGILKKKVKVIHNCIEVPEKIESISGEVVRKKYPFNGKVVLGLSTWFHKERKGFDILFKAFSQLDEEYVLLIVGIPEQMQEEVNQYAESFGIDRNRIFMPGYVDNIWEYYKAMNIFLLPSRSEGFSLALLEAAAAKLPLVASNIPGNDEFIEDGKNGLLFDIDKPSQLAEKIKMLAEDKSLARRLADNAHNKVMNNFLVQHLGERLEQLIKLLVNN
jgi:glycosyltransferase involved in cell wall biosynthesis